MSDTTHLYIKNMVCQRCIMAVSDILQRLGLHAQEISLGTVKLTVPLKQEEREALRTALQTVGFELIDDKRMQLIEQIRHAVIRLVHQEDCVLNTKLSYYLQQACHRDYSSLSKLFSDVKGISIEKYYIAQRIERAKELLIYDELTLNQIADRLHYSSTAHLSAQFKSITGLSPRQFKLNKGAKRLPLDKV